MTLSITYKKPIKDLLKLVTQAVQKIKENTLLVTSLVHTYSDSRVRNLHMKELGNSEHKCEDISCNEQFYFHQKLGQLYTMSKIYQGSKLTLNHWPQASKKSPKTALVQ